MVGWKKIRTALGRSGAAAGVGLARRVHRRRRRRRHHWRHDTAWRLRRLRRIRRHDLSRRRLCRCCRRRPARRVVALRWRVRRRLCRRRRLQHRDERRRRRRRVWAGRDRRPSHPRRSARESRRGPLQRSGIGNRAGYVGPCHACERSRSQQRRTVGQRSAKRSFGRRHRPAQGIAAGQRAHPYRVIPGERSGSRMAIVAQAGTDQGIVALRIGSLRRRTALLAGHLRAHDDAACQNHGGSQTLRL